MVKIRLKRGGKKFSSHYKVVVANSNAPRDGKFIEEVGFYNPITKECQINSSRVAYWIGVGAQTSDVVKKLLKLQNKSKS